MVKFNSDRFLFREFIEEDWHDVHSYAAIEEVCQFQTWGPNSEEETIQYVKDIIEDAELLPRKRFVFAVVDTQHHQMVGSGELNIRDNEYHQGEIGYIVNPRYWGRGYATEIARNLLAYGFSTLRMHRIYATCDPDNIGSARVLAKSGMKLEGRLRDDLWIKTRWRDSFVYSMLEHEWVEM